jgi:SEL1 protein
MAGAIRLESIIWNTKIEKLLPGMAVVRLDPNSGSREIATDHSHVGVDSVNSALRILRDSRIPILKREKPSGFLGHTFHYVKQAFYILFMNGPPSDHHTGTDSERHRLRRGLSKAIQELKVAAEEAQNPDAIFLLAEMNFYGNFSHPRNFKEAFRWYHKLASLTGNSTAQYMIGFMYATGIGDSVERDQAKALLYHTVAAEAGNTRSEMTLAFRYHDGIGAARNCDRATHYYKRVADKVMEYYRSGPPGGQTIIAESYHWADDDGGVYGEGASVSSSGPNANREGPHSSSDASLEDVLEYLDLMSKKGDLKATFSLGKMYYDGARTLPRNFRKAMKYFKLVAKRYWTRGGTILTSHPLGIEKIASKAAGHIGLMYLRGEGVEQNFGTALTWFKRGVVNGDPLCQHEIGLMYLHGYGVPHDAFKASTYFKAASEQDFPAAETRLGALFLDQGDVATATKYFELAARWSWMEAVYYLAEIANSGIGRERHCGIASSYYKMVAERAEVIHSSIIESNAVYESGDEETALIGQMMAAEQGYEAAQSNVAYLLDEQRSVLPLESILPQVRRRRSPLLRNAALALIYWTRSAKQANIDSLVKVGDYYLAGIGSSTNAEKASTCYHTAAEAHHCAQAFWNLGWMHENGIAVDQDFHMAKRFYDLALETNEEAYLPVKLSLIKLRIRSFWNRITYGNVNPIQDDAGKGHSTSYYRVMIPCLYIGVAFGIHCFLSFSLTCA